MAGYRVFQNVSAGAPVFTIVPDEDGELVGKAALTLVYGTFHLNKTYGEHRLMKAQARRNHPRYVINRRRFSRLLSH
jgi:hypothetical protein